MTPLFKAPAITVGRVSGMAFVQLIDFATVPDDMAVLEPKKAMSLEELYIVAALINEMRWRFSYYRKLTPPRLGELKIQFDAAIAMKPRVPSIQQLFPPRTVGSAVVAARNIGSVGITTLFDVVPGSIHNASSFDDGITPLVSCSDRNNGILGYFDVKDEPTFSDSITVAYNGSPLTAKYHHYEFAAKDDVAVLRPKAGITLETMLYVMAWLNNERWRYSYYRKCYQQKLVRLKILVPVNHGGRIDQSAISDITQTSSYWGFLRNQWQDGKYLNPAPITA